MLWLVLRVLIGECVKKPQYIAGITAFLLGGGCFLAAGGCWGSGYILRGFVLLFVAGWFFYQGFGLMIFFVEPCAL